MDRETLRKVQLAMLEIAKEVKRVCDENNIRYFMDSGTLLGAVRHQGFIPWDDDMDFGMVRSEYDRFLQIAPEKLKPEYLLQTWENDTGYGLPFAKVQRRDTIYLEENVETSNCAHGLFVDIFPYDNYPDGGDGDQGKPLSLLKVIVRAKCGYRLRRSEGKFSYSKKAAAYRALRAVSVFTSKQTLLKKYDALARKHNGKSTQWLFPQGISPYGKWLIPAAAVQELTELEFEGVKLSAPADYHAYLTHAYGDYMKLPPEDQRENRHGIVQLKL